MEICAVALVNTRQGDMVRAIYGFAPAAVMGPALKSSR